MEGFERGNHLFEVVDILPVNDQVHSERDAAFASLLLANLLLANPCGQFELVRMGARSGNPVRWASTRILKAELDVVEAGLDELRQTLARRPTPEVIRLV